jgi:hypothetical protein
VFKQEIERLAAQRAATHDEALREIIKLTLNAPFGKTLENKQGRKNFKVHTNKESFQRSASLKRSQEFRLQHFCEEDGSFLGTTASYKVKQAVLDTPRMMGWAILEYAKMVMTRFHYGTMKPLFEDKLKLLYTDTDSMYYAIRWPSDPIDFIAASEAEKGVEDRVFDLSQTAAYHNTPLKNKLGCFKYEGAGNKKGLPGQDNEIVEAVFPTSKSYMKRMALTKGDQSLEIKQKGVPGHVVKRCFDSIERYKEAVFTNSRQTVDFNQFRSFDHVVTHCKTSKIALSAENDKVFQVSPYESRPLGHYRNNEAVPDCPEWDLEESEEEPEQRTVEEPDWDMLEDPDNMDAIDRAGADSEWDEED